MPTTTPGQRLRLHRENAGLSRAQLAKASGISLRTIARAELENRLPTVERLERLAAALGITAAAVLTDREDSAA